LVRNLLAVLGGLFVGGALNMLVIQLNMELLYPLPPDLDVNDVNQFNVYLGTLPATAFLVVMVAHLSQAFAGGWVAARAGASHPMVLALIIGVLSLAGGIAAMTMFDGPGWMAIELPLYLVLAGLAGRIEQRRRALLVTKAEGGT
jgi:hypothetical protein